jgi:hypothetical protein
MGAREGAGPLQQDVATQLLRAAFTDADTFVTLNVPPRWAGQYASARSGVLWLMHQVSPNGEKEHETGRLGASERDVWGRTLPRQEFHGSQQAGAFIDQDNAAMVSARILGRRAKLGSFGQGGAAADGWRLGRPQDFAISRGTVLTDHAVRGDVDAVFSGRVAVNTCQTWPATHPFALRDELLAHALRDGPGGLPLWLCSV